jgi:two-component system chemotaxis response regulator CheB
MSEIETMPCRNLIVIGGGGRGAVEALCLLLDDLPTPVPAWILVAIDEPLQTAENMMMTLQGHTRCIVLTATDGEVMQSGRVYLAPRGWHLAVEPGFQAHVHQGDRIHGKRPAADVLFSSAAKHFGRQVIGVILSGSNEDGARGFRDIHATGGLRLVQSPSTAANLGMPLQATLGDHPNFICHPHEMGPLLGQLVLGEVSA